MTKLTAPLAFPNITFTPHTGTSSTESCDTVYRMGCEIILDVCAGRRPANVVNPEVYGEEIS